MLNERNTLLEDDGIEEEILVEEECSVAQAVWGDIQGNIENQTDLQNALDSKQDSLTEAQLNAVNSGITAEKVTTYDGYADRIASKADQSALNAEATTREQADTALGTRIDNEALARQNADNGLQSQIDAITSQSDVVDVVANYAALQAYDTSSLSDNDVIKVLDDETHEDALTYYRWSTTTQTWSYIGQEAPYYSKGQMDVMLQGKQDKLTAGANIQIENGTISATDTTYTAGNGLNLNGTEFSADTTVLATKSDLDNYYTKTETDTKLAPKLEAEVVAELPATGEEGKLYLTPKAHTTQTATGNPITATVAEDAGAIESFQLDGDTYQQTYTGKNLLGLKKPSSNTFGFEPVVAEESGTITVNGTFTGGGGGFPWISDRQLSIPAGTYTFSMKNPQSFNVSLRMFDAQGQYTGGKYIAAGATSGTFTLEYDCVRVAILIGAFSAGNTLNNQKIEELQLEAGSTASNFEPFVGGQPSPSPDYPQPIQTVTGLQTISINGTDYSIGLGSIELCKLSTYQDYIYKDGDDWKVHKALNKTTLNGSEDWYNAAGNAPFGLVIDDGLITTSDNNPPLVFCDKFYPVAQSATWSAYDSLISSNNMSSSTKTIRIRYTSIASLADFETWLAGHNTILYYVLATATDTTITDTNLIAQLEAIRTASLGNGTNTITNTATGTNLAGDMEIGYFEFNPTNRYDKFIWLDLNNNYEQIGS